MTPSNIRERIEDILFTKEFREDHQEWQVDQLVSLMEEARAEERKRVVSKFKKDLTKYEVDFTCICLTEHSVQFLIRKPKTMKGKITEIKVDGRLATIKKI